MKLLKYVNAYFLGGISSFSLIPLFVSRKQLVSLLLILE